MYDSLRHKAVCHAVLSWVKSAALPAIRECLLPGDPKNIEIIAANLVGVLSCLGTVL